MIIPSSYSLPSRKLVESLEGLQIPKIDLTTLRRKDWKPIIKLTRGVPLGYRQHPDNEYVLLPVKSELNLLEDAKKHLKRYPRTEVARWLSKKLNKTVTPEQLKNRLDLEKKHRRSVEARRRIANRLQKLLEEIELLEAGAYGTTKNTTREVLSKYAPKGYKPKSGWENTQEAAP